MAGPSVAQPPDLLNPERAPTSLVPYAPIGGGSEGVERCPSWNGWWWVNRATGERRRTRCGRNGCSWCGPINAMLAAMAMDLAEPERMVTFTQVGNDWQAVRSRMRDVTRTIRREGFEWNLAWSVEPNPKGTGHHVHGPQHGDFVPQPVLSRIADGAGMGYRVDIRAIKRDRAKVAHYGLKLAATAYGTKLARDDESLATYLRCNGGRMVHNTRGFWRDGARGERLPGVKAAISAAVQAVYGESGEWVLMRDAA